MSIVTWEFESPPLHSAKGKLTEKKISTNAEIAQLVEHNLAKVGVASSSLVFRSPKSRATAVRSAFSILRSSNGGMVDTRDLKSLGQKRLCGFESRFEH